MRRMLGMWIVVSCGCVAPCRSQTVAGDASRRGLLDDPAALSLHGVSASVTTYRGRQSMRLVESVDGTRVDADHKVALVSGTDFQNGTIEVWVAGALRAGVADTSLRGFVGVAFRSSPDAIRFENIFLRPANGRASDQLRRNHTVQYQSMPDVPWFRLRQDAPGRYESYVDIEPAVWTKMKIVVQGSHAELFVNDAAEPCLVVNDLKLGDSHGLIGLWIGSGTEAYFSDLQVHRVQRSDGGATVTRRPALAGTVSDDARGRLAIVGGAADESSGADTWE